MRPINTDTQSWGSETSNLVLQDIRSKAIADLNGRDSRRSEGQLSEANNYSPYHEEKREDGRGSTFVVDPVLSRMKHSGEELIQLTGKRWAEFCSEPRDETPIVEKMLKQTRGVQLATMKSAGQAVEDSVSGSSEPVMEASAKSSPKQREPALPRV